MRFAVLGPVTVTDVHGEACVNGDMQRLLLAMLLSRSPKPVTVDALIDALWGASPPDSPHKRLSWHIHRLRNNLGDADCIVRTESAYAMTVGESGLDVADFTRLCDAAQAAQAAGDVPGAAENWTAALHLWRGQAFGELGEHRVLRGEAMRLDRLRLQALEHRFDVEMELGNHSAIIEELISQVVEHPLRERFRGQLMIALYRSGRQPEALEAYREGRRLLVEQAGVEPGQQLRELHKEILRGDAAPAAPAPAAPAPAAPAPAAPAPAARPAELPAVTSAFTGRDEDVERLRLQLAAKTPEPVVITGTGGIGKSALAARAARLVADSYPDGQLYLNLRGATPGAARLGPVEALGRLLRSLDVEVANDVFDVDELAARFRSAVSDRRVLVVLDDAADAEQVLPLLPGAPNCGVVVTSRNTLAQLDGAMFLRLDVLSPADAQRLIHRLTGRSEHADIIELCGRMPLAICVAAARLNTDARLTAVDFAQRLRSQSQRLAQLDDGIREIRSTFMVSYLDLDAETARVFRRLGLHEGNDFSVAAVAALADLGSEQTTKLLAQLADAQLVIEAPSRRFAMHDLLRLFARECSQSDESECERHQAIERMLHSYLATARNALRAAGADSDSRCYHEPQNLGHCGADIADRAEAYAWVKSELSNLAGIAQQASVEGFPQTAMALAAALYPNLHVFAQLQLSYTLSQIAIESCESSASVSQRFLSYHDLVVSELSLGMLDEGLKHARQLVDDSAESGDAIQQARALYLLGGAYRNIGKFDDAVEQLQRSRDLCVRTSSRALESLVCMNIAMVHVRTRHLDDAARAFRRAAELAEQDGEQLKYVSATSNLGHVLREAGDPTAAISKFQDASAIVRRSDFAATMIESDVHWGLGDALYDLDRPDEARRYWTESADLLFRLGQITENERQAIDAAERPQVPNVLH